MNAAAPEVPTVEGLESNSWPSREFVERVGAPRALSPVRRLNAEMRQDQPSMERMIAVVEDAEVAYRLFIRLANGPSKIEIESAYEAFSRFGAEGFFRLAMAACVVTGIGELPGRAGIWPHLDAVSRTAEKVAAELAPELAMDAFCAGLMHDAMVPAMIRRLPNYMYLAECALETDPSVASMERDAYQFDHADAAATLASELDFPEHIAEAIRCHHHESISAITNDRSRRLLSVLLIAERVATIRGVFADHFFSSATERTLLNEISAAVGTPAQRVAEIAAENLKALRGQE